MGRYVYENNEYVWKYEFAKQASEQCRIAEEFNMSRKELKNFIKSEEMKEYLQYIFSDEYDSGVEQIESLSQTFKGKNPNYDKPISIVESIKKDIYEKKRIN